MSGSAQAGAPESVDQYLRTELLERIAHELRGPAGVTLGALDEIERLLGQQDNEESRALLSMARRGAKRVLRTAERLTRTAQLEAGIQQLATIAIDVRELVARATREAEQLEGRSAVQVELVLAAQPCVAHVDSNWLAAALQEVFSQSIRCARSQVQISVQCEGSSVRITARDDRTANPELPEARFLPLRDRRDCALGWPLARDVAAAHGGEITISPAPNADGTQRHDVQTVLRLRAG
jgi:signal transduction histidine kinase